MCVTPYVVRERAFPHLATQAALINSLYDKSVYHQISATLASFAEPHNYTICLVTNDVVIARTVLYNVSHCPSQAVCGKHKSVPRLNVPPLML